MCTVPLYILAAMGVHAPFPYAIDKTPYAYLSTL
jgi:hypothetical protein